MIAAVLTTLFFSLSVLFASRSAALLGASRANLLRIVLATIFLGLWSHSFGAGIGGPALPWFFLSGCIGFGLGDMALFAALTRIGPRLAILLTQCLAAPMAGLAEWTWLGTRLAPLEIACAAVILAGVAIALAPDRGSTVDRRTFWIGVIAGCVSAFGQGMGAVISRKANLVAEAAGWPIDGGSAAYQRILGGVLLTALAFHFMRQQEKPIALPVPWRRGGGWAVANALAGPAIGVACFQWALASTPSGIVLPIVATSPIVTMLLAWQMDGVRPTRRAVLGGVLAVAGAAALRFAQAN